MMISISTPARAGLTPLAARVSRTSFGGFAGSVTAAFCAFTPSAS